MKKLLMLTTGGTIASVEGENGLAPGVKADELLSYVSTLDNDYTMETQSLMNIDSTNMQPEYWVEIAEAVKENYDAYDGFVITHGTDTMAYTSAALSYMLQHAKKPIVITGSQIPITFQKTDAKKILQMPFDLPVKAWAAFMLCLTAESFRERVRSN